MDVSNDYYNADTEPHYLEREEPDSKIYPHLKLTHVLFRHDTMNFHQLFCQLTHQPASGNPHSTCWSTFWSVSQSIMLNEYVWSMWLDTGQGHVRTWCPCKSSKKKDFAKAIDLRNFDKFIWTFRDEHEISDTK